MRPETCVSQADQHSTFIEPGELSQWLCHDDSTINIVLVIIIIIIIINRTQAFEWYQFE